MTPPPRQRGAAALPTSSASELSQALGARYGTAIARAAMAAVGLGDIADAAVPPELVHRAVEAADTAEIAMAGVHFMDCLAMSAVAGTAEFHAAARAVGLDPVTLDLLARLRIDGAFARAWAAAGRDREAAPVILRRVLQDFLPH